MHICLISEDFAPNPGGMASHVYELARALIRLQHDVTLVCAHENKYTSLAAKLNLSGARYIWNIPLKDDIINRLQLIYLREKVIKQLYSREKYDIIHWHCLFFESMLAKKLKRSLKSAFVFTNHSSGFLKKVDNPIWRPVLRKLINTADCVIAPSDELANKTINLGINKEDVFMIPNGVDHNIFKPSSNKIELRGKYSLDKNAIITICPRRLVYKNGVDLIIKAWPKIIQNYTNPKCILLIVGDGPERFYLASLIKDLRLENYIYLLGSKDRTEMPRLYQLSDIAVLPSRIEAVSIAALEAMAVGLPVLATNIGGLPQIVIPNKTGRLAEPESSDSLAQEMIFLLNNKEALTKLGKMAREFVVRYYSWDIIAYKTIEVYMKALSKRRKK